VRERGRQRARKARTRTGKCLAYWLSATTDYRKMKERQGSVTGERLQKILSRAGVTSRRKAEQFIVQGRVSVNGAVVTELGTRAVWGRDEIRIDGKPIGPAAERVVLALFKPSQCVTTLRDPQKRRTVADIIGELPWRVYPVGRLDYDTEGLLLLTNDGELAHRLQHPRHKVLKTYEVKVKGRPGEEALTLLQQGVQLEDGVTAAAQVNLLEAGLKTSRISLTLGEGRYHQVKRMCEAVGHPVLRLKRTRVGPIGLAKLRPGEVRRLTSRELRALLGAVGLQGREREGHPENCAGTSAPDTRASGQGPSFSRR
jgi:23S rRNA pseudouridine2605 synthase